MKIKIATFNVNSIKARFDNVVEFLKNSNCDIVLLQEIKCQEEDFLKEQFFDLGYNSAVFGQKTYNGVAILSKYRIEDVTKGIPNFLDDLGIKNNKVQDLFSQEEPKINVQARYIEALIPIKDKAIRVASIYVPNGGGEILPNEKLEESEKFIYKINFFKALKSRLEELFEYDEIAIFGGDFNVANYDIDVYDAKSLEGKICFHPLEQKHFRSILNLGLSDCYRILNPQKQNFTWWDYRGNSWQNNKGLRIDYLLASPKAVDKITNCEIVDKGVRDREKASDHCPVVVEIDI